MAPKILISPLLERRREEIEKSLASHLKGGRTNFTVKSHPDVLYFESDSKLGITEARKIKDHLSFKPYQAKGKAVVLEDASTLTLDAQNALLKILEEPPLGSVIILGAPTDSTFLPTILSRCQIIYLDSSSHQNPTSEVGYEKDIERLLESDTPERFEYIEKLKTREEFLKALTRYFHLNLASHMESSPRFAGEAGGNVEFIKELIEAEKWANRQVNIRAILEYLMLIMPRI